MTSKGTLKVFVMIKLISVNYLLKKSAGSLYSPSITWTDEFSWLEETWDTEESLSKAFLSLSFLMSFTTVLTKIATAAKAWVKIAKKAEHKIKLSKVVMVLSERSK